MATATKTKASDQDWKETLPQATYGPGGEKHDDFGVEFWHLADRVSRGEQPRPDETWSVLQSSSASSLNEIEQAAHLLTTMRQLHEQSKDIAELSEESNRKQAELREGAADRERASEGIQGATRQVSTKRQRREMLTARQQCTDSPARLRQDWHTLVRCNCLTPTERKATRGSSIASWAKCHASVTHLNRRRTNSNVSTASTKSRTDMEKIRALSPMRATEMFGSS